MEKEALVKLLCSGYCSFYKPEKDEELACKGFLILEKLLDERKEVPVRTEKIVLGIKTESALQELSFFWTGLRLCCLEEGRGREYQA
jgi:hypothetical protein